MPVAPLNELLAATGLERRGDYLGPAGRPWQTPFERARSEHEALNASVYGFETCCQRAFDELSRAFLEFRARHAPDLEGVADAADHGQVTEAFMAAEVTRPLAVNVADDLFAFTEALIAGHEASPGVQFLAVCRPRHRR